MMECWTLNATLQCGSAAVMAEEIPQRLCSQVELPGFAAAHAAQRNLAAEGLFDKLDSDSLYGTFKSLYTTVYMSIEGIMPKIDHYTTYEKRVTLLGQVDAIDIFTDIYRTKRLKRLDYSATY
jgi:hypothetical protein